GGRRTLHHRRHHGVLHHRIRPPDALQTRRRWPARAAGLARQGGGSPQQLGVTPRAARCAPLLRGVTPKAARGGYSSGAGLVLSNWARALLASAISPGVSGVQRSTGKGLPLASTAISTTRHSAVFSRR